MKTPITYYGGKQKLVSIILPLLPQHVTYVEPFVGGGAIFWAKDSSEVEVINDTNGELINFYQCVQNDFVELEKMIRISLHSRSLHSDATVVYNNPHLFSKLKRAWAVWVLAAQSFSSKLNCAFGYNRKTSTTSRAIARKRDSFTMDYALRLEKVQVECTDALRVITSRDSEHTLHYCDPPYYNANCGHYKGYTLEDFTALLSTLSSIQGKFLLSSYPSDILTQYSEQFGWFTKRLERKVSIVNGSGKPGKRKIEVLTANYDLSRV